MSEYKHVVTAEAFGPEGQIFQRVTLEQFYDSSEGQVENQERLFMGVITGAADALVQHRDENAGAE